MRLTSIVCLLAISLTIVGCTKKDSDPTTSKTEDASATRDGAVKKLYARKDEFAAMKAPLKPEKGASISPAFIMFKLPGLDWEVVGMENDANRGITICNSDKCNNRNNWLVFEK